MSVFADMVYKDIKPVQISGLPPPMPQVALMSDIAFEHLERVGEVDLEVLDLEDEEFYVMCKIWGGFLILGSLFMSLIVIG